MGTHQASQTQGSWESWEDEWKAAEQRKGREEGWHQDTQHPKSREASRASITNTLGAEDQLEKPLTLC